MWLKADDFEEKVRQWWTSYQIPRTPSFIFAGKLKALKKDLKLWNRQSFGDIGERKKSKEVEIKGLERIQENWPLTQEEIAVKKELEADLERIVVLEETSWCQKLRAL
ncbi:hypothetical protein CIPAW_08G026800 [Carya illinoinensis]|uniref:Uncharacterized protein n=1 Tax=Carya illinoinensis TaxID=32201 RepID=A0A8T1PUN9_CARIL|nr:hypothetical protein CIPAW_08G026800 [Carya illinoinensis]